MYRYNRPFLVACGHLSGGPFLSGTAVDGSLWAVNWVEDAALAAEEIARQREEAEVEFAEEIAAYWKERYAAEDADRYRYLHEKAVQSRRREDLEAAWDFHATLTPESRELI